MPYNKLTILKIKTIEKSAKMVENISRDDLLISVQRRY
jgi:hypothetical protein